jgi:predicted ATPase
VARTVAAVLDLRESADKPVEETLIQHLAGRRTLLVLDNCEHLLETCAVLAARLLSATSALSVLVTSREALGVAGERVVPVRSLALPPPDIEQDLDRIGRFEAVRLFVERAAQVAPEFAMTPDNALAVVEICRRLDGIPLALELAAARVALLSIEQIRARLDDRFRLLTGSPRAISRHQTLLETLQSSYEYLSADEQRCFQRLSVFAGGWTLESAAAVAGDADDIEMLKLLGRLVDKSLVQVDRTGPLGPRYGMLETVRRYAQDRLDDSGSAALYRERHLAHFLDFARTAQANLFGEAMRPWLQRFDAELPNLLAAHSWCDHAQDGANRGLDLATNLRMYWLARGFFAFGQRVYDEALAREGIDPRSMLRGKALYALGQHHYVRGRLPESMAPTREALSIAREHGDDEWAVYCLDRLCLACGWLGDIDRARQYRDEELVVASESGSDRLMSFALTAVGAVHRAEGNFDAAADAYEQALTLLQSADDPHNRYNALVNIARVSVARGELRRARETLSAAIQLVGKLGTTYRGHFALEATSRLAAACADWRLAARLQGASDATVDKMGGTRTWFDDPVLAVLYEQPAAMLGAKTYAAAYDAGRELTLEAALDEAITWIDNSGTGSESGAAGVA